MSRIALAVWGGMSTDDLIDLVKQADRAGYESVFLIESYADQSAVLGACARETERILLGTGVTTAFYRTPTSLAIAGATVDALSHGRFVLGLGVGHREIVAMRDAGCAVLLVSAELEEATALSDRLLVLHEGRIAGEVDPLTATSQEIGLLMTGGGQTP